MRFTRSGGIADRIVETIINEVRKDFSYRNRGDEFYTQKEDVAKILATLSEHLRGKVVYCPCGNADHSFFYKTLRDNFKKWGLRGLYATWLPNMACYYDGTKETRWRIDSGRFQDTGDFFAKCDVVVTNPPFSKSQPNEMIDIIYRHGKEYIMIADRALTMLQRVFKYVRGGSMRTLDMRLGMFDRPDGTKMEAPAAAYTSFRSKKPFFMTGVSYDPRIHRRFDDLDAIDCGDNFNLIPDDYYGPIAVSANGGGFLRKLNDDQFEIISDIIRPKMDGKPKKRMLIQRKK